MLDRPHGNREGEERDEQEYRRALMAAHQQVENVMEDVVDTASNLASEYPESALHQISQYFEGISKQFITYTSSTTHMFYEVFRQSRLRSSRASAVARRASSVAQLFERYARNPKSYSAVKSRLEIHKLRIALENVLNKLL